MYLDIGIGWTEQGKGLTGESEPQARFAAESRVAQKPQAGKSVGHDLGLVVSPGDIKANTTFLWKNTAQSRLTSQKAGWDKARGCGGNETDGPGMRQV